MSNRPEISFLIQNVLPLFASQFDFPSPEDEKNTKIDEIPIRIASSVKKPDVVYYCDGIPIFLIEAKKEGKSENDAVEQALSYIRNFPIDSYSKNGIRPRFFSVTIGKSVFFYAHRFEIEGNNFKDWAEKLDTPLSFHTILREYGLEVIESKEIFTPDIFRKEILNELGPIYKFEEKITPETVEKVSSQVLAFQEYGEDYTSHRPYIDLDKYKDRQAQIRLIFERYNWKDSVGPEVAKEFRSYIIRAFQGTNLNQYLTEQCVIAFMFNLIGDLGKETKVLDFECGSGGFLAAAIDGGVVLENIRGVDIDELPFIIAKTYIALYFKIFGKEDMDKLPIKRDNGLFYQGKDWDLVIGNPAGSSKYEHGNLDKIKDNLNLDLDGNERTDNLSEYNLSLQQAVTSVRLGGKICLILPEGFYSNSQDEYLRKYIVSHCRVVAIISLPRGVFKQGTSTKQQQSGSHITSQKMSILYLEKINDVDKNDSIKKIDFPGLNYQVFLASVEEPEFKSNPIENWLEPELNVVLEQWREWHQNTKLKEIQKVDINMILKEKNETRPLPLFEEKEDIIKKSLEVKSKTTISKFLGDLFK